MASVRLPARVAARLGLPDQERPQRWLSLVHTAEAGHMAPRTGQVARRWRALGRRAPTPTASPSAGLPLPVTASAGDLSGLGAAVEVAAYRIGIEALTNAVRHAGATSAVLTLSASQNSLTIEVVDDGRTTAAWTPGTGITSMRE